MLLVCMRYQVDLSCDTHKCVLEHAEMVNPHRLPRTARLTGPYNHMPIRTEKSEFYIQALLRVPKLKDWVYSGQRSKLWSELEHELVNLLPSSLQRMIFEYLDECGSWLNIQLSYVQWRAFGGTELYHGFYVSPPALFDGDVFENVANDDHTTKVIRCQTTIRFQCSTSLKLRNCEGPSASSCIKSDDKPHSPRDVHILSKSFTT